MFRIVIVLVFAIFYLNSNVMCQSPVIVQHHVEGESAFLHLTEVTGSKPGEMSKAGLQNLLETLKQRINCKFGDVCFESLTMESIGASGDVFNEEDFSTLAKRILLRVSSPSANDTQVTDAIYSDNLCRSDVSKILRSIEPTYRGTENKCFGHLTILGSECTSYPDEVIYTILTNLFKGYCILPTSQRIKDQLFEHISANDDFISEQEFSHFLNELNIGRPSDPLHSAHDHRRRRRDAEEHSEAGQCFSDEQLRSIFDYDGNLNRSQVIEMCPIFIQQIVEKSCVLKTVEGEETNSSGTSYTIAMKYGYGTLSVTIISSLAFVGMVFFPVLRSSKFRMTMQFFIALGVGTMSGDAIFHILPEVAGLHNHDEHEEEEEGFHIEAYVWKLLVVVAGIWMMFIFENSLRLFSKKIPAHSHNHMHSEPEMPTQVTSFSSIDEETKSQADEENPDEVKKRNSDSSYPESQTNEATTKKGEATQERRYFWGITATGMMILFGDILHNFGDGIALGAAFSGSSAQGIGTSLAILFHELPHEFGDFAIYLNNGLSKWRALILNFVAACWCYAGLYVGIAVSENNEVRIWLLAAVAGMFLYISLVNVLHEMVQENTGQPRLQFLLQNLGLLLGWAILFLLAIFEESLIEAVA